MPRLPRRPPEASKRRPTGHARVASETAFSAEHTPLIVPHEKHALIRAHADARAKVRTGWGIGYYIGVAASCLVVVSGWWLTLDKNIRTNLDPGRDSLIDVVSESTQELQQNTQNAADGAHGIRAMQSNLDLLRQEYERARIQAEASRTTSSHPSSSSSSTH